MAYFLKECKGRGKEAGIRGRRQEKLGE